MTWQAYFQNKKRSSNTTRPLTAQRFQSTFNKTNSSSQPARHQEFAVRSTLLKLGISLT